MPCGVVIACGVAYRPSDVGRSVLKETVFTNPASDTYKSSLFSPIA